DRERQLGFRSANIRGAVAAGGRLLLSAATVVCYPRAVAAGLCSYPRLPSTAVLYHALEADEDLFPHPPL
ncbi:hypothetical protein ACJX0J_031139, partial [Zea mays]